MTYIDLSTTYVGIDPNFSFYLISIANVASGFGRLLCGILSDCFGGQVLTAEGGMYTERLNDRCHECYDTIHDGGRNNDLLLAICNDKSVLDCGGHLLWVCFVKSNLIIIT